MPELKAFRGWRYNSGQIQSLKKVLAPPYDVISKKEQSALYQSHPSNVIRLELGQAKKNDSAKENQYTRAASYLADWKSKRILTQESTPALYVYVQDYQEEGKKKTRVGFLAAMTLNEKAVLKHENTLAAPKKDRLMLLKEVKTNLSPIFCLFEDTKATVQTLLKEAQKRPPVIDVSMDGVRHRVFLEDRRFIIQAICDLMKPKPIFIADGHHRFEVACQYKRWRESKHGTSSEAPWNAVMTYFSDCWHNPFKIFPTHRLVRLSKNKTNVLERLQKIGRFEKARNLQAVLSKLSKTREELRDKRYRFGFYSTQGGFSIFTLNTNSGLAAKKNPVSALDVTVLHEQILKPFFGIHSVAKSNAIDFTRNAKEACRKVQDKEFDMAIFLRSPSLKEMIVVSKKGLKMPQKSTYFYPKLVTGLVFHEVAGGDPGDPGDPTTSLVRKADRLLCNRDKEVVG